MKLKQIITLIIIIAALAIAGVFAYQFFMNTVETEDELNTKDIQAKQTSVILPKGSELNFDTIKEFNPSSRLYTYPAVQPTDAGLQLNEMISPQ